MLNGDASDLIVVYLPATDDARNYILKLWSKNLITYLNKKLSYCLILKASYTAVVLFAYFDVKNNHPNEQPLIRYWPIDTFEFGVPFVQIKGHFPASPDHSANGFSFSKNKNKLI